jgi:hypothetical protein
MRSVDRALTISTPAATVEALYRVDADRLWRALFAFCADPDIASDSLAEAYAQLIRRGEAVRDAQAWTWRTAFVLARGALKGRSQAPAPLAQGDAHIYEAPGDDAAFKPSYSPDGSRIVFGCSGPGGDDALCLIDADGSNLEILVDEPGVHEGHFSWGVAAP